MPVPFGSAHDDADMPWLGYAARSPSLRSVISQLLWSVTITPGTLLPKKISDTHCVRCSLCGVLIVWGTHCVRYSLCEVLILWGTHCVWCSLWDTHCVGYSLCEAVCEHVIKPCLQGGLNSGTPSLEVNVLATWVYSFWPLVYSVMFFIYAQTLHELVVLKHVFFQLVTHSGG